MSEHLFPPCPKCGTEGLHVLTLIGPKGIPLVLPNVFASRIPIDELKEGCKSIGIIGLLECHHCHCRFNLDGVTGFELKRHGPHDSITCLICGQPSWNQHDISHRYCGLCHTQHEERFRKEPKHVQ